MTEAIYQKRRQRVFFIPGHLGDAQHSGHQSLLGFIFFCVRRANSHDGGDWGIAVSGYLYVHRLDQ